MQDARARPLMHQWEPPPTPGSELLALRSAVRLLEGEVLLEGWAAEQITGRQGRPGLLLVTDWRIIFIDADAAFAAFPIVKVDLLRRAGTAQLTISSWYGRMQLAFDNWATASAVENRLRQAAGWKVALGQMTVAGRELATGPGAPPTGRAIHGAGRVADLTKIDA